MSPKFRYLRISLSNDMKKSKDDDLVKGANFKQFHVMLTKFSYTDVKVLSFLPKTNASSFYEIETCSYSCGSREKYSISI